MATQQCGQCGAIVAADEQFCPRCGSFIDPLASGPRGSSRRPGSPPGNVISISPDGNKYEEFSLQEPPPEPRPSQPQRVTNGASIQCPSCEATNPAANRHCQQCGARLQQGALPTAPRPAVQATAGVRAAVAISALFLVVVLAAVLFNFFGGDPTTAPTTTQQETTTTPSVIQNAEVPILSQTCEPIGLGTFTCANLNDGNTATEYQVNWEELATQEGATIRITMSFNVATTIERIEWTNILDDSRFRQNYRARGIEIGASSAPAKVSFEVPNSPGTHTIPYAAHDAHNITIEILSAWNAEVVNQNVYRELAIAEILVWGRPTAGS